MIYILLCCEKYTCTVDGKSIPIDRVSVRQVECRNKFTIEMDGKVRAVEQVKFPALFPAGTGFYVRSQSGVGSRFSLRDYWKFRFNMPFSPYTRHAGYLMLMHAAVSSVLCNKFAFRVKCSCKQEQRVRQGP
jgi:hypothetical protein